MRGLDLYSVGSEVITFTNSIAGNKNVTKWEWTLVERPPGSTAILQGSDSSEAYIQTDVSGRYVVSLRVNDLGDGTPGYSITVAGVSYPIYDSKSSIDHGDWDSPAFSEGVAANWTDKYGASNPHGAQRELYRIASDIREHYLGYIDKKIIKLFFAPDSLPQMHNNFLPEVALFTLPIDMSDYNYGTVKFGAVLYREGAAGTAYASLSYGGVYVTGSTVSTVAGPVTVLSSALTVGAGAGELKLVPTVYAVDISIVGGGGGDFCSIYDAFILLDA
jgi:hypothetical protein